jgi:CheY-like chemotaxis protein
VVAGNGEDALEQVEGKGATGFDLILTDYLMPGMDGLSLTIQLQQRWREKLPPIIVLSSASDIRSRSDWKQLGIFACLSKPVRQTHLIRVMRQAMGLDTGPEKSVINPRPVDDQLGLRVLVADDNVINQQVAEAMLEKLGCTVLVVSDGAAALDAAKSNEYDLVLMDVYMPGTDGLEATRCIRDYEVEHGGHLAVIAMTASALESDRDLCLKAGMDDFLSKPVKPSELAKLLARLAEQKRNMQGVPPERQGV